MASKNHRGKTLWRLPARGRGTCPACNRTRIKLLYETLLEDGSMKKVCKECNKKRA